jgi:hypothetical protein
VQALIRSNWHALCSIYWRTHRRYQWQEQQPVLPDPETLS